MSRQTFIDEVSRQGFSEVYPSAIPLAEQEPATLVERVLRDFGRIDVLVSNDVILSGMKPIEAATVDEYRAVIEDVNGTVGQDDPRWQNRRTGRYH